MKDASWWLLDDNFFGGNFPEWLLLKDSCKDIFILEILSYTYLTFLEWIHEIEIWQCLTDLDKDKQGPAIYLSLGEKIRKTCSDIKVRDINSEDGVDILVNKLKSIFPKYINQAAYLAYDKSETFKRHIDINMVDFINEFERLHNNTKKYEMELPT